MLVVGLGNPGARYRGTRHNVGFDAVDRLAARLGLPLDRIGPGAVYGERRGDAKPLVLAKPQTFMNRSGEAVAWLAERFDHAPEEIVVVHDEADLAPGVVRVKRAGGLAGHRGLASIAEALGSTAFGRVRIGIGRPEDRAIPLTEWVLERPGEDERELIERAVERAAEAVEVVLDGGLDAAMERFNKRTPNPDHA